MKLQRGPALMMLAALAFTVMVSLVKIARQELDVFDVILFRGLVAVPVALVLARGKLRIERKGVMLLRSATGFGAMLCFFGAAKGLAIADLQIISRLQPLAVGFLAPLVLGATEKPKRGIWVVLILGLLGCGIIIGPELAVGSWWGGLALGAVLFSAVSHTSVRALKGGTQRQRGLLVPALRDRDLWGHLAAHREQLAARALDLDPGRRGRPGQSGPVADDPGLCGRPGRQRRRGLLRQSPLRGCDGLDRLLGAAHLAGTGRRLSGHRRWTLAGLPQGLRATAQRPTTRPRTLGL